MCNETVRSQGRFINMAKSETSTDELIFSTHLLENAHLGWMDMVEIKSSASAGANF